ncbi:MAG TPA: MaoC family dehydratase [Candidatus Dormibacteraeota bacterium]|nr:MaoC family dehydratase [Candidatus Dormibacteraeota bacterium]
MERYFEDYVPGSVFEFGHVVVDEAEVIEFAKRYDPQYIHTDPAAAAAGPFNGLIASGWHTAGLMMRMFVESYLSEASSLASPGIDELRWMKPVRPGDRLTLRATVLQVKRSTSKPDRGMVRTFVEVVNGAGEVVMSLKAMNLMRLRNAKV